MHSRNNSFPSVPEAVVLLLAGFLLQYLLGALLYDLREFLDLSANELNALVMLLANGILLTCVMHYRSMTYRDLFHPATSSVASTSLLLVPLVMLLVPAICLADEALSAFLVYVFPLSRWEEQAFASMVEGNIAAVMATCVLAPVLEEMLFRGVLLRAFLDKQSRWSAIAWSALLFGIAHRNIYQFVLAFYVGLLLGWLFERSRSLVPCIALHAALNSWVVFSELTREGGTRRGFEPATPLVLVLASVAAVFGALLLRRVLGARPA